MDRNQVKTLKAYRKEFISDLENNRSPVYKNTGSYKLMKEMIDSNRGKMQKNQERYLCSVTSELD